MKQAKQKMKLPFAVFSGILAVILLLFFSVFITGFGTASAKAGNITVTVIDSSDSKISGVFVKLMNDREIPIAFSLTDEQGISSFSGLVAGNYYVIAGKQGFFEVKSEEFVVSSLISTNINVQLGSQRTYSSMGALKIVSEKSANVFVKRNDGLVVETLATNSKGEVFVFGLEPREYEITVLKNGFEGAISNTTISSGTISTVKIKLKKILTGSIAVNLTNAKGKKLSGSAQLLNNEGILIAESSGTIGFKDLPIGSYKLIAQSTGFQSRETSVSVSAGKKKTLSIKLSALPKGVVEEKGSVIVFAKNSDDETISGASVSINGNAVETDESGKAIFSDLALGNYSISVSKTGFVSKTERVALISAEATKTIVLMTEEEERKNLPIEPPAEQQAGSSRFEKVEPATTAGNLNVTVLSNSQPIEGAKIEFYGFIFENLSPQELVEVEQGYRDRFMNDPSEFVDKLTTFGEEPNSQTFMLTSADGKITVGGMDIAAIDEGNIVYGANYILAVSMAGYKQFYSEFLSFNKDEEWNAVFSLTPA